MGAFIGGAGKRGENHLGTPPPSPHWRKYITCTIRV